MSLSDPLVVDCKFVCLEADSRTTALRIPQKRDIPDFHFRTEEGIFISAQRHLGEIDVNHISHPLSETELYLTNLIKAICEPLDLNAKRGLTLKFVTTETERGYEPAVRGEPLFESYDAEVQLAKSRVLKRISTQYDKSLEWLLKQGAQEQDLLPLQAIQETTSDEKIYLASKRTFTGLIARCQLTHQNGNTYSGWAKIGITEDKRKILHRAAHYAQLTSLHSLLHPIKPIVHAFYNNDEEGISALLTYDAHHNLKLVALEDQIAYFALRTEIIQRYAEKTTGENRIATMYDSDLIDIFDVALEHTFMREHKDDPHFKEKPLPFVVEYDKIESWLSSGKADKETIGKIKKQKQLYQAVAARASSYGHQATILANLDRRRDNTFLSQEKGERLLHVYGDDDLVAPGTEEIVLGSMGQQNLQRQVRAYVFMRQALERKYDAEINLNEKDLLQKTRDIAFLSNLRFGAYEASQSKPSGLINLALQYAPHC